MKTTLFRTLIAAAGLTLYLAGTVQAYVELSDEEIRNRRSGRTTLPFGDGSDLHGGQIYFVDGFSTNGASYYLYLPSAYSPTSALPVLVFMNSATHGMGPLMAWLRSAEDLGWIVLAPHEISNWGPPNSELQMRDILAHARTHLAYDSRRVYMGGISGGACRAYALARSFRGEFAGMIDIVGWMCDYDEYTYYPGRLAVAHLSGEANEGGLQLDDARLTASGVRTAIFKYEGGHVYPKPEVMDETLRWLEQEFAQTGQGYVEADGEELAAELLGEALRLRADGDFAAALPLLLDLLERYAYTRAAPDAETALREILQEHPPRTWVDRTWWDENTRVNYARNLFQRALYYEPEQFPESWRRLFADLAVVLDPTSHHALDLHGRSVLEQPHATKTELFLAQEELRQAATLGPRYWRTHFDRLNLALRLGTLEKAPAHAALARTLSAAWYDPFSYKKREIDRSTDLLVALQGRSAAAPTRADFLTWVPGELPAECTPHWYVASGSPAVLEHSTAAGHRALHLRGLDDVVRITLADPLAAHAFVAFDLLPLRGDGAPLDAIYLDHPFTFRIDAGGRIGVRSPGPNPSKWTTLEHAPLPEDTWCRIGFSLDLAAHTLQVNVNGQDVPPALAVPPSITQVSYVALESWTTSAVPVDLIEVSSAPFPDDLDANALPDEWELGAGLQQAITSGPRPHEPERSPNADPDSDGLSNLAEWHVGTDPLRADTDGDRMDDGSERAHGLDPLTRDAFSAIQLPASNTFADALADGWNASADVRHRTVNQPGGAGHLVEIQPSLGDCSLTRLYAAGPKTVIWLTLTLQPTPGDTVRFTETMQRGAALLYLNTEGHLVAFDGSAGVRDWIVLDRQTFPLDQLIEVRLRLDYRDKTWSVWKGSELLADKLGFADPSKSHFSSIAFEGTGLLDTYQVAAHGPDEDGDGIPDDWERHFFRNLEAAGRGTDSDGDGFPDASEYLAGTDPHDPASLLEIVGAQVRDNRLHITWQAKPGNYEGNPISYNLLKSKRLAEGVMPPVACEILPEGAQCTYTITGSPEDVSSFYAVEAAP